MRCRLLRSVTAAWLALLLGLLQTGLPSHSHETDAVGTTGGAVVRAEHHTHGVTLVEQAERVQSTPVLLPALAAPAQNTGFEAPAGTFAVAHATPLRPLGRAPPPANASRAPPQHS
jgi:hypothetical protein